MAVDDDKRRNETGGRSEPAPSTGPKAGERDLGHALRSVYGDAVKEEIPGELLDLLGKLS